MQKIIIDTNVLVSALIQRSYPYLIVNELVIENKNQLCVSDDLLTEYYDVLARPKFARFPDFFARAEALLVDIETKATKYSPSTKITLISDVDDNKFLEPADVCSVDFIITGNTTDFTFTTYKQTKIVTPKQYWEDYKPA
jgi:putative PIN family toxin of toxin-antitoxin system